MSGTRGALWVAGLGLLFALGGGVCRADPDAPPAPVKQKKGPPPRKYVELKSGIYDLTVTGMLCTACAAMIAQEAARVNGIETADVDFDSRTLRVVVTPRHTVRLDAIKRALGRAARRMDLGTVYAIAEVTYVP